MMENQETKTEILIIGAGAAGLMAAWELARTGKRVVILEARDRIGGRIWPLKEQDFGYLAQAGAEFVHGPARVTKELIKKAGLTFVPMTGEIWSIRDGEPVISQDFMPDQEILNKKLQELKEDLPIASFLDQYFGEEKYSVLRNSVIKMVEGYDAADPKRISTLALREEWLGGGEEWQQGRIKEGYGKLLDFLESECRRSGVEIRLNAQVKSVKLQAGCVQAHTVSGQIYEASKIVITVPLSVLGDIVFNPEIKEKIEATSQIGFGHVIKILLRFKDQWWIGARGKDFRKMMFMLSNEEVTTWWTQYPEICPVLTGWMAGPTAARCQNSTAEDLLELGLIALANIFKVDKDYLREQLVSYKVINWPADPLVRGAYSYTTPETKKAYAKLIEPVNNTIFFAGEALYAGKETATVEGALASGKDVAGKVLALIK